MTSVKTQLPFDYYSSPFCEPIGGKDYKAENLGKSHIHMLMYHFVNIFHYDKMTF